MVKYGIISFIIGVIGVISHGAENLSKGEASASYQPSALNNVAGTVFSILMWGGLLLIVMGIIFNLANKNK